MSDSECVADGTDQSESDLRLRKIHLSRSCGIDPYPAAAFRPSHTVRAARLDKDRLIALREPITLAGRVIGRRHMARAVFLDVLDEGAKLQIYVSVDEEDPKLARSMQLLEIGDFVGLAGHLFVTRRGETTLFARESVFLGKPLRQVDLGKKSADGRVHHALSDTGRLMRERHVKLLTDEGFRKRLVNRDKLLRVMRAYFHEEGFTEVETPVLGRYYGGAAARPFKTHVEALDCELFLRVSPECSLKRLLCGGMNKVFEIGKNFRNEGIDYSHNPEFTSIEWYEAWSDYRDQMIRFENVVHRMAVSLTGSPIVHFRGKTLDFTPPWPRLRVVDAVAEAFGLLPAQLTIDLLLSRSSGPHQRDGRKPSWGEALMEAFEREVEPVLWGPTFVIDHPIENSPLTKVHRCDPRFVERFEPFAGGIEIGNAYSELNDPSEQRARLVEQSRIRSDSYDLDHDFLSALDDGMPQAGGAGMGVDRIVMLLTEGSRLSDVLAFPMV